MNIPKEATEILARMKRRGYKKITVGVDPRDASPFYVYVGFTGNGMPAGTHMTSYDCEGESILACCREIEREWKEEQ